VCEVAEKTNNNINRQGNSLVDHSETKLERRNISLFFVIVKLGRHCNGDFACQVYQWQGLETMEGYYLLLFSLP